MTLRRLRSVLFYPDWDWQFHELGNANHLRGVYLRPKRSFVYNIGDCFGTGVHAVRTNLHYFMARCTVLLDLFNQSRLKIVGSSTYIELAKQRILQTIRVYNISTWKQDALTKYFIRQMHSYISRLSFPTSICLDSIFSPFSQRTTWVRSKQICGKKIWWTIDRSRLPQWLPYNKTVWASVVNMSSIKYS